MIDAAFDRLLKYKDWNDEQMEAPKLIRNSQGGMVLIMGIAGTGKTLLQEALLNSSTRSISMPSPQPLPMLTDGALRKNFASGQCGQGVKGAIVIAGEATKDLEINIFNAAFEQAWDGKVSGLVCLGDEEQLEPQYKGSLRNTPAIQQTLEQQEHMRSIWPKLHELFGEKPSAHIFAVVAPQHD
ncbi:hypothetical protein KC345_g1192 [Hortaea werneckii]|nr:hypothetical protein KC345_g1192 [Hortaea werneckii]